MRRLLAGMLLPVVIAGCSGAGSESRAQPVKGDPAFPGAVGYGAAAKGGRGGRILGVDTLADGGPGSLRACIDATGPRVRSEEHTSELQSLMRISYAVFCLKKKITTN